MQIFVKTLTGKTITLEVSGYSVLKNGTVRTSDLNICRETNSLDTLLVISLYSSGNVANISLTTAHLRKSAKI